MSYYFKDDIVTAKVRHRCAWCSEWCEVGEKRHNRAYRFDGEFQSDFLHLECHEAMCNSDISYDDGFEYGAMERGKTIEESDL